MCGVEFLFCTGNEMVGHGTPTLSPLAAPAGKSLRLACVFMKRLSAVDLNASRVQFLACINNVIVRNKAPFVQLYTNTQRQKRFNVVYTLV